MKIFRIKVLSLIYDRRPTIFYADVSLIRVEQADPHNLGSEIEELVKIAGVVTE